MVDSAAVAVAEKPAAPAAVQRPSGRLLSWDVLRVLGVFAVLAFHATLLAPVTYPGIDGPPWRMDFPFGASLLLTISGYFAALTIGKHTPIGWLLRRFARLLPAYLAAVLIVFTVSRLFAATLDGFPQLSYRDLAGNLVLVQVLLESVQHVDWPHWTVPVQVAAFAGIFLLAAAKVRGRAADVAMWLLLLGPLGVRFVMYRGFAPEWLQLLMDGSGLNRVHLFLAGIAVYRWSHRWMAVLQLVPMLAVVLLAHAAHPPDDSVLWYGFALVLVCLAAGGGDWAVFRPVERPIRWLGANSYGIYLMHFTIGTIIARRMSDAGLSWWVWVPAFFGSAVVLGWLLTRLVERPAFRLLTKRLP